MKNQEMQVLSVGDAVFPDRPCGSGGYGYQLNGIEGLRSHSRRPLHSPNTKVSNHHEQLILDLRTQCNLGARRIQSELLRQHTLYLGLATIHKVLQKHQVKPIKKLRKKNDYIRYARPLPGDRVQMDTCKIAPGLYQYTSVDDCTRYITSRFHYRARFVVVFIVLTVLYVLGAVYFLLIIVLR